MEISDYAGSVKDLINLTENLDRYEVYPGIEDYDDPGRMYIDEYGILKVPDPLKTILTMLLMAEMLPWMREEILQAMAISEITMIPFESFITETERIYRKNISSREV
jgi:antirestriction protein ArdA